MTCGDTPDVVTGDDCTSSDVTLWAMVDGGAYAVGCGARADMTRFGHDMLKVGIASWVSTLTCCHSCDDLACILDVFDDDEPRLVLAVAANIAGIAVPVDIRR